MKVMGKALRTFSLFLLLGACVGTISNNKNNNVEAFDIKPMVVRKANEKPIEIQLFGDYDRLYAIKDSYKANYPDGQVSTPDSWRDAHAKMTYINDNTMPYYQFILRLEKGDMIKPFVDKGVDMGWGKPELYLQYNETLGANFSAGPNNTIKANKTGYFKLKYKASSINSKNMSEGWLASEEVNLTPKYVNWMYKSKLPSNADIKVHAFDHDQFQLTHWTFKQESFSMGNDMYRCDVSYPLANGYKNLIIHDGGVNETKHIDLTLFDHLNDEQITYFTIDNTTAGLTFNYLQKDTNPKQKLTSSTARVWVDDELAKDDNRHVIGMHMWDDKGHVEEYLPTGILNLGQMKRNLTYFDIPTDRFNESWNYMFKIYLNNDNTIRYSYNHGNAMMKDLSTSLLTYLYSPKYEQNEMSQNIAIKEGQKINVNQLKLVFDAYFTCLPSKLNGYGDFKTLANSWLGTGDNVDNNWIRVEGDGETVDFYDYNKKDTASYETGENKTNKITLTTKINGLKEQYKDSLPQSNFLGMTFNTSLTTSIIICSSILAVAVLGFVTFIISKKVRLHR